MISSRFSHGRSAPCPFFVRTRRAFSMIEFLGALVVSGIVSSMALVGYRVYERELPVRHAASRLSHAFATARAYAIAQNAIYAVRIDRRYKNFWIDQVTTAGVIQRAKVTRPEPIDDNVVIDDVWFGLSPAGAAADPLTFRFLSDGSSDDGRVFFVLDGKDPAVGTNVYTVRIYGPTGQSKVFANQRLETTTGP